MEPSSDLATWMHDESKPAIKVGSDFEEKSFTNILSLEGHPPKGIKSFSLLLKIICFPLSFCILVVNL